MDGAGVANEWKQINQETLPSNNDRKEEEREIKIVLVLSDKQRSTTDM